MAFEIEKTTGGTTYVSPLVGRAEYFWPTRIDLSALTSREVDAKGNLKPGAVFNIATGLLPTAAGQKVGVVHEAVNLGKTLAEVQARTNDVDVALCVIGVLSRDIMEDNLGAALSAAEIAALDGAGSRLVLGTT